MRRGLVFPHCLPYTQPLSKLTCTDQLNSQYLLRLGWEHLITAVTQYNGHRSQKLKANSRKKKNEAKNLVK